MMLVKTFRSVSLFLAHARCMLFPQEFGSLSQTRLRSV